MNLLKALILTTVLLTAPFKETKAAVAGAAAIFGSPAAGGIAIAALYPVGIGGVVTAYAAMNPSNCEYSICLLPVFVGVVFGAIILDDNSNQITFNTISEEAALKLGLSEEEFNSYNEEIEEVNVVFDEVKSKLTGKSSIEKAQDIWSDYSQVLSAPAFSAMKKLSLRSI